MLGRKPTILDRLGKIERVFLGAVTAFEMEPNLLQREEVTSKKLAGKISND